MNEMSLTTMYGDYAIAKENGYEGSFAQFKNDFGGGPIDYSQEEEIEVKEFANGGGVGSMMQPKRGLVNEPGGYAGFKNPFNLNEFISDYPGKDRIQELQNIDYTNNPRDMGVGTASDFRHAAAMNELSKSLSPGFVPDFVGDSLAYGLGAINEVPDAFRGFSFKEGFNPESMAAAKEDFAANKLGTFGTPNTATIEDVFAKTLGYEAPRANIETASAIGTPMGYGAAQASEITPSNNIQSSGIRSMADVAGPSTIDRFSNSVGPTPNEITDRNRGQIGSNNLAQDLAGVARNTTQTEFDSLVDDDFEEMRGINFRDAPVGLFNRQNNPAVGFIDKFRSQGNPDASLVNRTKNALGSGIGSIMDFMGRLPTPMNAIKGFANSRNALSKGSQNYNPALQSQVDFLNEKGMYGKNANSGLAQITGGRLAGKNLQSLFGSNDLQTMYDKDLTSLEKNLEKLDTRFSKLKKSNLPAFLAKQQTLLDKIAQNKTEAAQAQDAADKAAKAGAPSFNPNTTSGGAGNYRSDRDHSGAGGYGGTGRASNEARSNDLGFSDIRLKDNIELVGKSPSDINIYNFTYLNDPKVYQGVMAQEVPWASVKHDSGYLMVDYNKVDVDFKVIH